MALGPRLPCSQPRVCRGGAASTHHVVAAPVEQVEVVVVHEVGRVQDALLRGGHVAELLAARRLAEVGRVERREPAVVALRRRGRLLLERQDARLLVDVEAGGQQLLVLLLAGGGRRGLAARGGLVLLVERAVLGVQAVALGDEAVELRRGVWSGLDGTLSVDAKRALTAAGPCQRAARPQQRPARSARGQAGHGQGAKRALIGPDRFPASP